VVSDPAAEPANPVRPTVDIDALQAALDAYLAGGGPPALSAGGAPAAVRPTLVESEPFPDLEPGPILDVYAAPARVSHLFAETDEPVNEVAAAFDLPYATQPAWDRHRRALAGALALVLVLAGVIAVRNPFGSETNADTTVPPASATTQHTGTFAPLASAPRAATVAPPISATATTAEATPPVVARPRTTAAPRPHATTPPTAAAPPASDPATTVPNTTVPNDPQPTSEPPTSSPPPTEPPTTAPKPPKTVPEPTITVPASSP
jgi:hypothetical protein